MASTLSAASEERREWRRHAAPECVWLRSFRFYPGRGADLVNLSRGGALVESRDRFVPGAWLQIKMVTDVELMWSRAQILRCEVARLSAHLGTTYRTAIGFEHPLTIGPLSTEQGYRVPGAGPKMAGESSINYPERA